MAGRSDFAFPEPPSTPQSGPPATDRIEWTELLIDFLSVGFSEELFWSLTPRQVQRHFLAAGRREARAYNVALAANYNTIGLPYSKKPVSLKDLLLDEKLAPKRRQSWQEQKALVMLALGVSEPEPQG